MVDYLRLWLTINQITLNENSIKEHFEVFSIYIYIPKSMSILKVFTLGYAYAYPIQHTTSKGDGVALLIERHFTAERKTRASIDRNSTALL